MLVNGEAQTEAAREVAREIVGDERVRMAEMPMMGSEDFADMLQEAPGSYAWLGMAPGAMVHNAHYVFDDAVLPIGASFLARIAERRTAALANVAAAGPL